MVLDMNGEQCDCVRVFDGASDISCNGNGHGSDSIMAPTAQRPTRPRKKSHNPSPSSSMDDIPKSELSKHSKVACDCEGEGNVGIPDYCPSCPNCDMQCKGRGFVKKYSSFHANVTSDGDCASYDLCNFCDKKAGKSSSSSFFDCKFCDRSLCGNCVTNVPCESGCGLSNCVECAENGDGDVLYCAHCGRGFCTDCKSMEFCYCLEGNVCPECHSEMHDYDVECYWRHLPLELQQIVADFAVDISKDRLAEFWQDCIQFLPPDKEFDIHLYRRTRRARAASLILASYHLLKGQDDKGVCLILYAALLEEVWNRGANYVSEVFDNPLTKPSAKRLCIYFTSFQSVLEKTATTSGVMALLHNQLPSIRDKEGRKLFECLDFELRKMHKSNILIHSVPILSVHDYEEELEDQYGGHSLSMNIITSNMDIGTKQNNFVYKDMTLGWWLKIYVIKCTYHNWLSSPVTSSTRYFRVVHKGKTLFLNTAGKATLHQLGIKDGDEIIFESVESEVGSTISYGSKMYDSANTCTVCGVKKMDSGLEPLDIDTCHVCEKSACTNCSTAYFDCEYCDRLLCGDCTLIVPCDGCELSNCMECAENGDGDVLYCTNCGRGFCQDCMPMEFCFCLVGDTCPECHSEMHDHDVECYWHHLPSELPQVVSKFALEISSDQVAEFWQECLQFLLPDKEFDIHDYRKTRQARAAALILASDHLLKGLDKAAFYLILYAALLEEVWNRGANYIKKAFGKETMPSVTVLVMYFNSFRLAIEKTTTKANTIAFLHNQLSNIQEKEGKELLKCLDFALGKMQKPIMIIHSVTVTLAEPSGCQNHGDSLSMNIIVSNMDNGRKEERPVYKDMTLGWWLKIYVIRSSYQNWLRNGEIPPSTKYFRVVHQGTTIFLSSSGKKTFHQLGIEYGDEIVVGGIESESKTEKDKYDNTLTAAKKGANANRKPPKKIMIGVTKKKNKSHSPSLPSLTEEQLMDKYRQEHSAIMTPIFEELDPLLKDIRNRLNDLTIKKTAPKVRRPKSARKTVEFEPRTLLLPPEDSLGGKPGKIAYPILVGDDSNLHNTSTSLSRAPITVDLHGCTRDEALIKLDESLPNWINTAMTGEYPFILAVDIICGGGSQILSEVVQRWIRTNRHVANRPRGFI